MNTVLVGDYLIDEAERKRMAEEYLSRGWSVLPVKAGSKLPACVHGVKDAVSLRSPEGSRNWRLTDGYWLAVATGEAVQVLDVDVKGDKKGLEAIEKLEEAGVLAGALGVVHTPSGGRHYYFPAHPDEKSRSNAGWGLDWQCSGKYVVAPPSPGYVWESYPGEGHPIQWSDVCAVLGIKVKERTSSVPTQQSAFYVAEQMAEWIRTQPNNRNAALYWAACRLAEAGSPIDSDYDLLKAASLSLSEPGEDREHEVEATINSAKKGNTNAIN